MNKKQCTKCGSEGPFVKDKTRKDGLFPWCNNCTKANKDQWRKKNLEKHNQKCRKWAKNNRDKSLEIKRKYSKTHPEQKRKDAKIYRERYPERVAARNARRRALRLKTGGSYTWQEFVALCEKYDNRCLCCGSTDKKLTADHIIPITKQGSSNIDNIQPLCQQCNSSKGNKTIDYRPDISLES